MLRTYATGRMWPFRSASDLLGAVRRAESVAKSLSWSTKDVEELAGVIKELGRAALAHAGGGSCRLEVGNTQAEVIVEDLGGACARTRVVFTTTQAPIAAAG